jgi:proteasome lid subunit RPN8/RPN11
MYLFPIDQIGELLTCAKAALPREAAGLLLRREFKRFIVLSVAATSSEENTPLSFRIRDVAIDKIAESLINSGTKICGCFHSHVVGAARPSKHDCAATKKPGDLWLIYSVRFRNLNLFSWDGMTFQKERFRIASSLPTSSASCKGVRS